MTTLVQERRLIDVVLGEPLQLAKDQPHQVLLSTGSVVIMAQFAAHGGIVHWTVGYAIAIGVEWAYLRGLAYDGQAPTRWGAALNWSAFAIVVLWGVLWVSTIYGAIPERPGGVDAVLLAIAHIVPIAWLALCSAMCHRTAAAARATLERQDEEEQKDRQRREAAYQFELQQQRDLMQLDLERKYKEQRLEDERRAVRRAERIKMPEASQKRALNAHSESINTTCPKCGTALNRARWMAAKRWGYCAACKEQAV